MLEASAGFGIRVRLVRYTEEGERLVAAASKLSLSRKPVTNLLDMDEEEVDVWIRETLVRGHFSPWEHSTYTWIAEGCTRVCSHQLVRHRIASYTQQSMRYTEGVLREAALRSAQSLDKSCPVKPGKSQHERKSAYECYSRALLEAAESLDGKDLYDIMWIAYLIPYDRGSEEAMQVARAAAVASSTYYWLLSRGAQREDARFVIPHMVRTRIIVTMNARELVQSFFPLRMCTRAQWEIRRVAWALHSLLNRVHPKLFKYAGPRCLLLENMQRKTPATLEAFLDGREKFTIDYCPEQVPNKGIRACLLSSALNSNDNDVVGD